MELRAFRAIIGTGFSVRESEVSRVAQDNSLTVEDGSYTLPPLITTRESEKFRTSAHHTPHLPTFLRPPFISHPGRRRKENGGRN